MNRQYSRDGLLNEYQKEAKDTRDKKIAERQNRVQEERYLLDQLNKKLDSEKSEKQNVKLQRINEMKEEYNKMLLKKQGHVEESRKVRKESYDANGTFKIGDDKREIKRKSYDEVSDALVINPMKNNRGRVDGDRLNQNPISNVNQASVSVRGKSQGFNIISHIGNEGSYYPPYNNIENKNSDAKFNQNKINNQEQNQHNNSNFAGSKAYTDYPQHNAINKFAEIPLGNNQSDYQQKEISQARVLDNNNNNNKNVDNNYNYDQFQPYDNNRHIENNPEINDPDFQQYYQEYIRKRLADEEIKSNVDRVSMNNNARISTPREIHSINQDSHKQPMSYLQGQYYNQESNLPNQEKPYDQIRNNQLESNHIQNNNQTSCIDHSQDAHNVHHNLNSKNNSEYNRNKMTNQVGFGFNHRNIQNQNFANLENELNMNKESYLTKQKIQENYRHFLDTQINEKNIIKNFQPAYHTSYNTNSNSNITPADSRTRFSKKNMSINVNPYSTKNYEFGGTQLDKNPLTNPVNSYQFNTAGYRQSIPNSMNPVGNSNPVSINRNVYSPTIRQTANNLIINHQ